MIRRSVAATVAVLVLVNGNWLPDSRSAEAEEIRVLSWNVESGGNDADVISERLEELQSAGEPYDLIALTEVRASNASDYEDAVEVDSVDYRPFVSDTGGSDRMMIFFREDRFEMVDPNAVNLTSHNGETFPGGSARRPLFVRLEDSDNSDLELIFMVNHLTRGNGQNRRLQARLLREWARDQALPVIAVGDYNFDFEFNNLTGNRAMATFMRRDASDGGEFVWKWVIPGTHIEATGSDGERRISVLAEFVDTNWADRDSDGKDDFPDSILDFVFVAQDARNWKARSTVVVRDNDFPDDGDTSDHRPIEAILDPSDD